MKKTEQNLVIHDFGTVPSEHITASIAIFGEHTFEVVDSGGKLSA